VGIIVAPSGNRALVQEASGKGYIIKKGTYIGLNSGRVAQIQPDRVIIEEEIEDIVGKFTTRKKEIVLPKPPGE
jgi:type IV pilus assembly protein PilP